MPEHEEARMIELHDAKVRLQPGRLLPALTNLVIAELQAQIVGPQQLHVAIAAEDAAGNETVISLAYHGSFTVWWVDWSPDLEAYEEEVEPNTQPNYFCPHCGERCYPTKDGEALRCPDCEAIVEFADVTEEPVPS